MEYRAERELDLILSQDVSVSQTEMTPVLSESSPISRIPIEILSRIFTVCLPDSNLPTMDSRVPPIVLGQVCRTWRAISLHTPQLWNMLRIPGYYSWEFGPQRFLRWIERTGALPLSFDISATELDMKECLSNHELVVANICSFPGRWKYANLHSAGILHSFPLLEIFLDNLHNATSLEYLRVVGYNRFNRLDLSNVHGLRELDIAVGSPSIRFVVSANHFKHLRSVELETYTPMNNVLSFLANTRYTERLNVRFHECAPVGSESHKVELPYLKSLHCTFDCSPVGIDQINPTWGAFFSRLHVPALDSIHIEVVHYLAGDFFVDMAILTRCLRASQQSLISFEIRYTFFSPQTSVIECLIDCLRALPNLRFLKVGYSLKAHCQNFDLARVLTIQGGTEDLHGDLHESICPLLEEIEFRRCRLAPMADILGMIRSRLSFQNGSSGILEDPSQALGTLKRVCIESVDEDPYQDVSDFGNVSFQNLKFEVISGSRRKCGSYILTR